MMTSEEIIAQLPYQWPFLFVDELNDISEEGVVGSYTFRTNLPFYQGHFINNPITPGAILTECCAQIGLVCYGFSLIEDIATAGRAVALTSSEMEFLVPVLPGETVTVTSKKVYFRFNKLKCKVRMRNEKGQEVCRGTIAGIIVKKDEA